MKFTGLSVTRFKQRSNTHSMENAQVTTAHNGTSPSFGHGATTRAAHPHPAGPFWHPNFVPAAAKSDPKNRSMSTLCAPPVSI